MTPNYNIMTTEQKTEYWFCLWDQKMKSLKAGYDFGFEWLPVNEAGETDADALLKLNNWYAEQEAKIKAEMTQIAAVMFGD